MQGDFKNQSCSIYLLHVFWQKIDMYRQCEALLDDNLLLRRILPGRYMEFDLDSMSAFRDE